MGLGVYVNASTANPTGWRPWNSRLSFYKPAAFSVPTTSLSTPQRSLGLGRASFPNFPSFAQSRNWRSHAGYPTPVYQAPGLGSPIAIPRANPPRANQPPRVGLPPVIVRAPLPRPRRAMAGLGAVAVSPTFRRAPAPTIPRTVVPIVTYPAVQNPGFIPPPPVNRSWGWGNAPHATTPSVAVPNSAAGTVVGVAPGGCYVNSGPGSGSITSYVLASTGQCGRTAPASSPSQWGSWGSSNWQNSYAAQQAAAIAANNQAAAAAAAAQLSTATVAATPADASATAAPSSGSWFTEDSLGWGLPNVAYLGIAVGGVLLLKGRR